MYPEKKGGSHKMARPQQNWGLLTLLTRRASIWTMPNTASPKSEPPCGRAVYTPVRANILGHPPQKTAPGGTSSGGYHQNCWTLIKLLDSKSSFTRGSSNRTKDLCTKAGIWLTDPRGHSFSQPPVHPCFARAIELIAHPKITQIL